MPKNSIFIFAVHKKGSKSNFMEQNTCFRNIRNLRWQASELQNIAFSLSQTCWEPCMYYSLKYITYERFVEREGRSSIGKRRRRRSRERPKHKKGTVSVFHLPFPLEDFNPQVPYYTAFDKVNSKKCSPHLCSLLE